MVYVRLAHVWIYITLDEIKWRAMCHTIELEMPSFQNFDTIAVIVKSTGSSPKK